MTYLLNGKQFIVVADRGLQSACGTYRVLPDLTSTAPRDCSSGLR